MRSFPGVLAVLAAVIAGRAEEQPRARWFTYSDDFQDEAVDNEDLGA